MTIKSNIKEVPANIVHVPLQSLASLDDIVSKIILQASMDGRRSVATDYALLIDTSSFMAELAVAKCFNNHPLLPHWYGVSWWCTVCGECNTSLLSDFHCDICNFDACSVHCPNDDIVCAISLCKNHHAMKYVDTVRPWKCNMCKKRYTATQRIRCEYCDYDKCAACLSLMVV